MRSVPRALLIPKSEWMRTLPHQEDIKRLGGTIHQDAKNQSYAFIFSNLTEARDAESFLHSRSNINARMVNADDLLAESLSTPDLTTNNAPEGKSEHKPLITPPITNPTGVSLDQTPLTGKTLLNDSQIRFSSAKARDPSHWRTRHVLDDKKQLTVTHLTYSQELNEFEEELAKKGLVGGNKDLFTVYDSKNPTDFILPMLVRFNFIIKNKDKLKNLSTRQQFIIVANLMADCHKLMVYRMGMPDSAKKKYESIFNLEWSIFSLYASLINYNYVVDDEKSIQFPIHHKLMVASIDHILDTDIPEIYEMLCQIYDIEMREVKATHAPISERFKKDAVSLADISRFMVDVKKFNRDINKLRLGVKLTGINQVCLTTGNYYHLQSILQIIERVKGNKLSSHSEKVALLSCLIQIGELIKKLSPELQKKVNIINWESFKIVRDCLEHPDEAGRNEVINKLMANEIDGAHLLMIQQEIAMLGQDIQRNVLDRFYVMPGQALLADQEGRLFDRPPASVAYKIPDQFKLDAKEKEKVYKLVPNKDKDYWQRVFTGSLYLTDEAIIFLTTNTLLPKDLIEKILGIDESFVNHSLTKWNKKYSLPPKDIKNFLIIAKKIGIRDVCIQMLEGIDVSLSPQKITELAAAVEKINSTVLFHGHPLELKEALIKATTDFGSAGNFFRFMIENIVNIRPVERVFRAFRAVSESKYVPDMNLQEVAAFAIKYLKHVDEMLHDKLHTPEFTQSIFSRLSKLMTDQASLAWLTPEQKRVITSLMQRYPDPSKMTESDSDRLTDIWIKSGIYAANELHFQSSQTEGLAIQDSYADVYGKNISELLLNDPIFREEIYFYLSVIFGLIKKLMDTPGVIPEEIMPFLQQLKMYRNFLGHLDDHVASMTNDPEKNINIVRLGSCIDHTSIIMQEAHKTLSRSVGFYHFPDEDKTGMDKNPVSALTGRHSASLYAAHTGSRALSTALTARDASLASGIRNTK